MSETKKVTDQYTISAPTVTVNGNLAVTGSHTIATATTGNIYIHDNSIESTNTNGDITLSPNGTGVINVDSSKITNVSTPTATTDAANKGYVDTAITNINWKPAVRLVAVGNVPLSGTIASMTALNIDGYGALTNGFRLLLAGQTTASDKGIYTYNESGLNYTLTRASDSDTYSELSPAAVVVTDGTTYSGSAWIQKTVLSSFSGQSWAAVSGGAGGSVTSVNGLTGVVSGLVDTANSQTISGLKTISVGTSTANTDFFKLTPTDYGTGKPQFSYFKTSTANIWSIGLWDGVDNSGTINISSSNFTWNSAAVLDAASNQTIAGLKTISINTATTLGSYIEFKPTDYGTNKPSLIVQKSGTATLWNIMLYDGSTSVGTINFAATTGLTWNGTQLVDLSTAQTLTNKSLSDSTTYFIDNVDNTKKVQFQVANITTGTTRTVSWPDASGTVMLLDNAQTITALKTFTAGTSTSNTSFATFKPTDYGTGKPEIYIKKAADATIWEIGLNDGVNSAGTVNFVSTGLTWNNNQLLDTATVQTISSVKTFSSSNSTSNASFIEFSPTDYAAGNPKLQFVKSGTASKWNIEVWDGSTNNGTVDFVVSTLTHNGNVLLTSHTTSNLNNKSWVDSSNYFIDNVDSSKKVQFQLSGIGIGTTRIWSFPDADSTFVGTNATQTLTNKTLSGGMVEGTVTSNTSTAYTIDYSAGRMFNLTLTGNCTYTFPTPTAGYTFRLIQRQDATGSRTVTWASSVRWPGGTAPTLTATASRADLFEFWSDGTVWYGRTVAQNFVTS